MVNSRVGKPERMNEEMKGVASGLLVGAKNREWPHHEWMGGGRGVITQININEGNVISIIQKSMTCPFFFAISYSLSPPSGVRDVRERDL